MNPGLIVIIISLLTLEPGCCWYIEQLKRAVSYSIFDLSSSSVHTNKRGEKVSLRVSLEGAWRMVEKVSLRDSLEGAW